jgi:hypothetical protein
VFAPKGILSSSPLQAAGLSNGVNQFYEKGSVMSRRKGITVAIEVLNG